MDNTIIIGIVVIIVLVCCAILFYTRLISRDRRLLLPLLTILKGKIQTDLFDTKLEGLWNDRKVIIKFERRRSSLTFSISFQCKCSQLIETHRSKYNMAPLQIEKTREGFVIKAGLKMGFVPKYSIIIPSRQLHKIGGSGEEMRIKKLVTGTPLKIINDILSHGFNSIGFFKSRIEIRSNAQISKVCNFRKAENLTPEVIDHILNQLKNLCITMRSTLKPIN